MVSFAFGRGGFDAELYLGIALHRFGTLGGFYFLDRLRYRWDSLWICPFGSGKQPCGSGDHWGGFDLLWCVHSCSFSVQIDNKYLHFYTKVGV